MTCRVCGPRRRLEIDQALLEGHSLRDIADEPGQRHKAEHLARDLVNAHEAREIARAHSPAGRCTDRSGPGGEALWRG